jgi:hypothetical protein
MAGDVTSILNWSAFLMALVTSVILILHRNWRWAIGLLALQYLAVFLLIQTHFPISMSTAKLVSGWMACVVLGIAQLTTISKEDIVDSWPQGWIFRIFTAGIIIAATFALALRTSAWLGISMSTSWGSLLLIGMGLLHLGISSQPFRVILGLLTILAGFEILYAAVESSTLVVALLSAVNLGLALTGAYFVVLPREERQ